MDNNLIILLSLSWQIKYHQKIQYFFNFSSSTSNDDPERSSTHLQAWSQAWSKHLLKHFLFDLIISTDFISKSRLNPNLRYSHSAPAIRSTLHSVWKSQKNASGASYVYILSGQKVIKNAKNHQFVEFY